MNTSISSQSELDDWTSFINLTDISDFEINASTYNAIELSNTHHKPIFKI